MTGDGPGQTAILLRPDDCPAARRPRFAGSAVVNGAVHRNTGVPLLPPTRTVGTGSDAKKARAIAGGRQDIRYPENPRILRNRRIVSCSRAGLTGLVRWAAKPASRLWRMSSSMP